MTQDDPSLAHTPDQEPPWPAWAGDPDPDVRASWQEFLARNVRLDTRDRRFLARLIELEIKLETIFGEYNAYHARGYDGPVDDSPHGYSWTQEVDWFAWIESRNPPD
jgi:hypothetical protein